MRSGSLNTFGGSCPQGGSTTMPEGSTVWIDRNYKQDFEITGDITITHSLGKYPAVTVIDSGGNEVDVDVIYLSTNQVRLLITPPTAGSVTCN